MVTVLTGADTFQSADEPVDLLSRVNIYSVTSYEMCGK